MSIGLRALIVTLVVAGSFGCSKNVSISETKGACADIHKSQVCTWAKMQGETLLEVSASVPFGSIENAPADTTMVWPPVPVATLDIPEVARQKSGMTNLTLFWEPHGHPTPTFLTPHFDFHFNGISSAELTAIDCKDLTKPASVPAGYELPDFALPPDAQKMMGVKTMVPPEAIVADGGESETEIGEQLDELVVTDALLLKLELAAEVAVTVAV